MAHRPRARRRGPAGRGLRAPAGGSRGLTAVHRSPGLLLGIETSCDETAAAVVEGGAVVRSNAIASQADIHAAYGGVFPEMASRQHIRDIVPVVNRALADAGITPRELQGLAVTRGPGLAGSLLVGVNFAKGFALANALPLVGVNHLVGHLYSNWLHDEGTLRVSGSPDEAPQPVFPHLTLVVSGGHTLLVLVAGHGAVDVVGRTLDDAAGEAFDKAARALGLGYPGGPEIERAAAGGDPEAVALPVADLASALDFSFSGLKTALLRHVEADAKGGRPGVADLAASFQAAVVRALVRGVRRALERHSVAEVHLAGGVSANMFLRDALRDALDVPLRVPPLALCTDNAAMIAAAAFHTRGDPAAQQGLAFDVEPGLDVAVL